MRRLVAVTGLTLPHTPRLRLVAARIVILPQMFLEVHGTAIVMLGVKDGVLVGADKRAGNALSTSYADEATKMLQLGPGALATGWGTSALVAEDDGHVEVDILGNLRRIAGDPQFRFDEAGMRMIGDSWIAMMEDHVRRLPRNRWPQTPSCGYWFKSLLVYRLNVGIKGGILTHTYESRFPIPRIGWSAEEVRNEFVTGGKLLVEGDGSGMERIEAGDAEFSFLPATRQAWGDGIDPSVVTTERGTRILQDALYSNHLYSERKRGYPGVGDSCDIAMIDTGAGFRWILIDANTAP